MSAKSLLFGLHAVHSAINNDPGRVLKIYFAMSRKDKRLQELLEDAESEGIVALAVDKKDLDKLSGGARHQSIVCEYKNQQARNESELVSHLQSRPQPWTILVLDGVTDPHNLGACLRSADAAGVDAVIAPKDRAVGLTPVVAKVAAGAAESVDFFQVTNLKRTLETIQKEGVWVIGTSDKATAHNYTDVDYTSSIAIVMGAEGSGIRRLTEKTCDQLVSLPMAGTVSSLNVSVATGVCLFEIVRQRR